MLPVEHQIVDLARGRLLANTREFCELPDLGVVSIGCLARIVHLRQIATIRKRMRLVDFKVSAQRSHLRDRKKDEHRFADMTLTAPVLVYQTPEGLMMMIDGVERIKALEKSQMDFVDIVQIGRGSEAFLHRRSYHGKL